VQYRAPHWLAGAHAQTIWPALLAPHRRVAYRRERWETPDGDFIDVDFTAGGGARPDAPLVVLFHGLEGSSQSHYARATMAEVERRGWRGAVAHFRGCSASRTGCRVPTTRATPTRSTGSFGASRAGPRAARR